MIIDGVAAGSTQLPFLEVEMTTMKPTEQLHHMGQSLWLDNITRGLLTSGTLERYIRDLSITGLTSNPSIFDHAIRDTGFYDEAICGKMQPAGVSEDLFFELALEDLTKAADLFRPIHDATNGVDGWVSLEVSPLLADEPVKTLAAAKQLFASANSAESVHQDSRNSERTLRD